MLSRSVCKVFLFVSIGLAAALTLVQGKPPEEEVLRRQAADNTGAERIVFLGGNLSDLDKITLTAAVAGSGHPGVVLFDSARSQRYNRMFFKEFQPRRVIPVGSFSQEVRDLEGRLQVKVAPVQPWQPNRPAGLWKAFFPRAQKLVVSPSRPRRLLLQAACLAGALRAPLFVTHGKPEEADNLHRCLTEWPIKEIYAAGDTASWCRAVARVPIRPLPDEDAVVAAYLRLKKGPVQTLIVANPEDSRPGSGGLSALAPWVALQKHALLLCTNAEGTNVEAVVEAALKKPAVKKADTVILMANLQAIPMQRRPNPLPEGKDRYIEMEPLTSAGTEPHSFAVGRLFHDDDNVVALVLARPRLLAAGRSAHKALVVSNPGGGLPLLETFSRNTAQEFANAGYDTTALFGRKASRAEIRRLLPEQSIFLWEGHHSTLVRDYEIPDWNEPLRPSLVFLQSCLALDAAQALPFLRRGACGVIGTSSRTYSASGGAFALAYFDALLYEHQSLGGSLRHAKNFLQAFAQLKEKRLGQKAKLGGANVRTAWAFTLWGDPTLKLPAPSPSRNALPRVRHQVRGNTIHIALPDVPHEKAATGKYESQMWANARLGGLLKIKDDDSQCLLPLVFAEVHLPPSPPGKTPRLHSRLPGKNWVFCWDARRSCGYLLATPRTKDSELNFLVRWN